MSVMACVPHIFTISSYLKALSNKKDVTERLIGSRFPGFVYTLGKLSSKWPSNSQRVRRRCYMPRTRQRLWKLVLVVVVEMTPGF